MRFGAKHRHVIDFIFPISVFFVFAASSLAVLILAANIYSSSAVKSEDNYTANTPLVYVSEKIRQNDRGGAISIQTVDDTDCLLLSDSYEGVIYSTYIYESGGMLKELFIKEGVSADLSAGKDIMKVHSFTVKEMDDHLFRFAASDSHGKESTLIISERSAQ